MSATEHERAFWDACMDAYEDMLQYTSTAAAPWYVVPADHKWFTRLGVAAVIAARLEELNPSLGGRLLYTVSEIRGQSAVSGCQRPRWRRVSGLAPGGRAAGGA